MGYGMAVWGRNGGVGWSEGAMGGRPIFAALLRIPPLLLSVATDRPRGRRGVLVASGEAGGGGARLRVVRLPPTNGRTDETRVPWPMVARAP